MKKNPKILLVDDDKDMCQSLADVLTLDTDYTVKFTIDPFAVLDMMEKDNYSLIIVDYKMPDMNGIELLEKIKNNHPGTKVFILTAFISDELIEKARKKGAEKVLSKFIWPEEMLKQIKKHVK